MTTVFLCGCFVYIAMVNLTLLKEYKDMKNVDSFLVICLHIRRWDIFKSHCHPSLFVELASV